MVARAGGSRGPARRRGRELSPLDPDSEISRLGPELAESVIEAVPGWIARSVEDRYAEWVRSGSPAAPKSQPDIERLAQAAGRQAADAVAAPLRALLCADIDDQRTTPLALVRPLVAFATGVLSDAGVPPVARDEFQELRFPDDRYGLTPASLAVLGEEVRDLALAWGAAKAFVHRRRHSA